MWLIVEGQLLPPPQEQRQVGFPSGSPGPHWPLSAGLSQGKTCLWNDGGPILRTQKVGGPYTYATLNN